MRDKLILIIRLLLKHGADTRHILHFHKIPTGSWLLNIEPGFFPLVLVETFCKYIPDKKGKTVILSSVLNFQHLHIG